MYPHNVIESDICIFSSVGAYYQAGSSGEHLGLCIASCYPEIYLSLRRKLYATEFRTGPCDSTLKLPLHQCWNVAYCFPNVACIFHIQISIY